MPANIPDSKEALRSRIRAGMEGISPEERADASARVCALLKQQLLWRTARLILFFAPLPEEIDVWPLFVQALSAGKQLALPRFNQNNNGYMACRVETLERDLVPGKFGIREPGAHCPPVSPPAVDLILVPGMAFDGKGRRLGRGKGFYDRLLASIHGTKCGVAFDQQVLGEIPLEQHDVCVDYLVTPTRWIGFGKCLRPAKTSQPD